jgi:hypothetical protein
MHSKLCRDAGGVEALLALLSAARRPPPSAELPRDEEAVDAAVCALHALLVLLTGETTLHWDVGMVIRVSMLIKSKQAWVG